MQHILIIGGSRFIGPLLVEELGRRGYELTLFNRGLVKSAYPEGIRFIRGDRNEGFAEICGRFDVVIDMCAYRSEHTERALKELSFDFFIHVSTAAAYRKTDVFPLRETDPLGDWPLWGEYNQGKVACERILEASGAPYAAVRPVYILGARSHLKREQFIYSRIREGRPLVLPGNGQALVQFVWVRDVARMITLIAERRLAGPFNCAGNELFTLKGAVEAMGRAMGREPIIGYNPAADGVGFVAEEFPFANEHLVCANAKIARHGMTFTPLAEMLREDFETYYRSVL